MYEPGWAEAEIREHKRINDILAQPPKAIVWIEPGLTYQEQESLVERYEDAIPLWELFALLFVAMLIGVILASM